MWVPEFVCGVVFTVVVELVALVVAALYTQYKKNKKGK